MQIMYFSGYGLNKCTVRVENVTLSEFTRFAAFNTIVDSAIDIHSLDVTASSKASVALFGIVGSSSLSVITNSVVAINKLRSTSYIEVNADTLAASSFSMTDCAAYGGTDSLGSRATALALNPSLVDGSTLTVVGGTFITARADTSAIAFGPKSKVRSGSVVNIVGNTITAENCTASGTTNCHGLLLTGGATVAVGGKLNVAGNIFTVPDPVPANGTVACVFCASSRGGSIHYAEDNVCGSKGNVSIDTSLAASDAPLGESAFPSNTINIRHHTNLAFLDVHRRYTNDSKGGANDDRSITVLGDDVSVALSNVKCIRVQQSGVQQRTGLSIVNSSVGALFAEGLLGTLSGAVVVWNSIFTRPATDPEKWGSIITITPDRSLSAAAASTAQGGEGSYLGFINNTVLCGGDADVPCLTIMAPPTRDKLPAGDASSFEVWANRVGGKGRVNMTFYVDDSTELASSVAYFLGHNDFGFGGDDCFSDRFWVGDDPSSGHAQYRPSPPPMHRRARGQGAAPFAHDNNCHPHNHSHNNRCANDNDNDHDDHDPNDNGT